MMKFKTNAKCGGCEAAIGFKLNQIIKSSDWKLDLSTDDKELTVTADVSAETIMEAVKDAGFTIEKLS